MKIHDRFRSTIVEWIWEVNNHWIEKKGKQNHEQTTWCFNLIFFVWWFRWTLPIDCHSLRKMRFFTLIRQYSHEMDTVLCFLFLFSSIKAFNEFNILSDFWRSVLPIDQSQSQISNISFSIVFSYLDKEKWREKKLKYFHYFPPTANNSHRQITQNVQQHAKSMEWLPICRQSRAL